MRRITKVALGGVASCALILGGTQAAAALSQWLQVREEAELFTATGPLVDAHGKITIGEAENGATVFRLRVTGIDTTTDPSIVGKPLGSHLHEGPCEENDFGSATPSTAPGGKAGRHYNHDVMAHGMSFPGAGVTNPAEVSLRTEVWFDLVVDAEGMPLTRRRCSFVPVDSDGEMSVVVHVLPTNTELNYPNPGGIGTAGGRQACFPLSVKNIFPTAPPAPTE